MSYSKEQVEFLDEIYVEESPEFGEPELDDISFPEMGAIIMIDEFRAKIGREPSYKEMSQGW